MSPLFFFVSFHAFSLVVFPPQQPWRGFPPQLDSTAWPVALPPPPPPTYHGTVLPKETFSFLKNFTFSRRGSDFSRTGLQASGLVSELVCVRQSSLQLGLHVVQVHELRVPVQARGVGDVLRHGGELLSGDGRQGPLEREAAHNRAVLPHAFQGQAEDYIPNVFSDNRKDRKNTTKEVSSLNRTLLFR